MTKSLLSYSSAAAHRIGRSSTRCCDGPPVHAQHGVADHLARQVPAQRPIDQHAPNRVHHTSDQRGAVSVETALLVPLFVLIVSVAAAGWRISWTHTQVHAAAQAAARAASLKGDAEQARTTATAIVQADLKTAGVHCASASIAADVAVVAQLAGTPGSVHVGVECTVRLADLLVPGLPGTILVRGDATEAIDIFSRRGR